jgi:choline dehydrogenase-like flavoprotein
MGDAHDVCVVGGGPAGLTVALTLGAAGRRVVLLESGRLERSDAAQELNAGDNEGEPYLGLDRTRFRGLGGTVNAWDVRAYGRPAAKYVPLSARDLADWPIGWNELEPYYVEAQSVCGLGPFEYGADRWSTPERRPFDLGGTGLANAVYQFGYAERFTRELVNELLDSESISVLTSTTVVALDIDQATHWVRAVRAVDGDGTDVEVNAGAVVLACGAVENARLLLLAGLGDPGGSEWLGRCFMEHPRDFSLVLIPSSPELVSRAGFYDLRTSDDGFLVGGRLTLTDEARERHGLPNGSLTVVPKRRLTRRRRLAQRAPGPLRRLLRTRPPDRYGWSRLSSWANFDRIQLILNLEQRPDPRNRIELGARCDRLGNPLPRLLLTWTDEEQKSLEQLRELLREWLRTAGLGELMFTPGRRPDLSAHHHAGTTRMALDRKNGVVDPDSRVFGIDNLYVAGASVFPSAGFANPTLTIVALARRLGRHLARELAA